MSDSYGYTYISTYITVVTQPEISHKQDSAPSRNPSQEYSCLGRATGTKRMYTETDSKLGRKLFDSAVVMARQSRSQTSTNRLPEFLR